MSGHQEIPHQLHERFCGTLLGAAVGDALGASFEGLILVAPEAIARVATDSRPLSYSDDTHMTLGLAESLVACGGFDGEHLAQTFLRNYAAEPWRGYGTGPQRIFALLRAGVPGETAIPAAWRARIEDSARLRDMASHLLVLALSHAPAQPRPC